MIEKHQSLLRHYQRLDTLYTILKKVFFVQSLLCLFFLFLPKESQSFNLEQEGEAELTFNTHLFAVNQEPKSLIFSEIEDKMQVFLREERPGENLENKGVLISVNPKEAPLELWVNSSIFFDQTSQDLKLSKEESQLTMTLKNFQGSKIQCLLKWGEYEKTLNLPVQRQKKWMMGEEILEAVALLQKGFFLHPDQLFEVYGKLSDHPYKGKYRILAADGSILFVTLGGYLQYSCGAWSISQQNPPSDLLTAKVIKIQPEGVVIKVWEPGGRQAEEIVIGIKKEELLGAKTEELFTKICQRSDKAVSCKVGADPFFLKKGDWLIKYDDRWRLVKKEEEVDAIAFLRAPKELFVFDGLEKIEGKTMFKGTLFDRMRTHMHKVLIPLSTAQTKNLAKDNAQAAKGKTSLKDRQPVVLKQQKPTDFNN